MNVARHYSNLTLETKKSKLQKKLYLEGRRKFDISIDTVKADIQLHKMWHLAIK